MKIYFLCHDYTEGRLNFFIDAFSVNNKGKFVSESKIILDEYNSLFEWLNSIELNQKLSKSNLDGMMFLLFKEATQIAAKTKRGIANTILVSDADLKDKLESTNIFKVQVIDGIAKNELYLLYQNPSNPADRPFVLLDDKIYKHPNGDEYIKKFELVTS